MSRSLLCDTGGEAEIFLSVHGAAFAQLKLRPLQGSAVKLVNEFDNPQELYRRA
jgi:hypothetical protein